MNLDEFKKFFNEQVKQTQFANEVTGREAFLSNFTEILINGEEFDEFQYLPFDGTGLNRRSIQIDGYCYDELNEALILFILPPLNISENETLTATEAKKYFDKAKAFIEDAILISKTIEKSSPAYGFSLDINGLFNGVSKYRIYLLTDMIMSKKIRNFENSSINYKKVEYNLWDFSRLHEIFESGNIKEEVEIDFKSMNHRGIPSLLANQTSEYTSYLCNMPGIILSDIYNKYGSRLLEGNVRSFLQTKGKVNKGIRNSILNTPKMFFAYNNGIAATASECTVENINGIQYITSLRGLQIVNGGQTTASIATAFENDKKENAPEKIKEIYVPMKLSIVDSDKAREIIPRIAEFANTQNKVSASDLRSTHPFHIRMEEASRRIVAPAVNGQQFGTKWFYERANGQYAQETYKASASERAKFLLVNPKKQLIKKTTLAKYMNIHDLHPDLASKGGENSFIKFHEDVSKKWDSDNTQFNDDYFRRVIAIAIIAQETDKLIRDQDWFKGSYKANIAAYTISKLVQIVSENLNDRVLPYKKIWDNQNIPLALSNQIVVIAKAMYEVLTSKNRKIENVTEWAKRPECWSVAKELTIHIFPDFIRELDYKDKFVEDIKTAKKDQKEMNDIQIQTYVYELGDDFWQDLYYWAMTRNLLNPKEQSFVTLGMSLAKMLPSDKQCKVMFEILKKVREEGYPK